MKPSMACYSLLVRLIALKYHQDDSSMVCAIPFSWKWLFLTPTTTFASLREGTWLTRLVPQPQRERVLYTGFLINRWRYISLAYCL